MTKFKGDKFTVKHETCFTTCVHTQWVQIWRLSGPDSAQWVLPIAGSCS